MEKLYNTKGIFITKKPYLIKLKIAFSAKLVDLQVRVGILPLIGLITSIV